MSILSCYLAPNQKVSQCELLRSVCIGFRRVAEERIVTFMVLFQSLSGAIPRRGRSFSARGKTGEAGGQVRLLGKSKAIPPAALSGCCERGEGRDFPRACGTLSDCLTFCVVWFSLARCALAESPMLCIFMVLGRMKRLPRERADGRCFSSTRLSGQLTPRLADLLCSRKAFRDVLVRRYRVREERVDIVPGGVQADAFNTRPFARRGKGETRLATG